MKKVLFILIFLSFTLPLWFLARVEADPGVIKIEDPLGARTLEELIERLINIIFLLAVAVAPLIVIIGACFLMFAAGDPQRVERGKNIILYTMIGLAIIFLARAIVFMIREALAG